MRLPRRSLIALLTLLAGSVEHSRAFSSLARGVRRNFVVQERHRGRLYVSSTTEDAIKEEVESASTVQAEVIQQEQGGIWSKINEKIGQVDEARIVFPEYNSGEVDRMFSSLKYMKTDEGKFAAARAAGSVAGAAALVTGTTVSSVTCYGRCFRRIVFRNLLTLAFLTTDWSRCTGLAGSNCSRWLYSFIHCLVIGLGVHDNVRFTNSRADS